MMAAQGVVRATRVVHEPDSGLDVVAEAWRTGWRGLASGAWHVGPLVRAHSSGVVGVSPEVAVARRGVGRSAVQCGAKWRGAVR